MARRKRLNWRVLIGTLVAVTLAAGGLFLLHARQMGKTAALMLSYAGAAEESDPRKAAEYLDRYLRISPKDHAARIKLAQTYAKAAASPEQLRRAVELFYRALSVGPEAAVEIALRQKLADLLLQTGRLSDAEKEAQKVLLADSESPEGNRILALAAYVQFENGAYIAADPKELQLLQKIDKARQLNPADISLAVALATMYRERAEQIRGESPDLTEPQRYELADMCLDKLVLDNPETPRVRLARFAYRSQYKLPGAQDDLVEALRLGPEEPDVLRVAARTALAEAQQVGPTADDKSAAHEAFQLARERFEKLLAVEANRPSVDTYLGLGDALLGQDEIDLARTQWRAGLQHKDFAAPRDQLFFQSRIADALLNANRLGEANEPLATIDQLLVSLGGSVAREERHMYTRQQELRWGTWHIKQGAPLESIPHLRQVIATQRQSAGDFAVSAQAWLRLAEAYSLLAEWEESAQAFDQVGILQPKSTRIHAAAANAWLLAGRPDLASERAEQAIALSGTAEAWYLLANAQFRLQLAQPQRDRTWNRFEQALRVLEKNGDDAGLSSIWQIAFLRADYCLVKAKASHVAGRGFAEAANVLRDVEAQFAESREFLSKLCLYYQLLEMPGEADRVVERIREVSAGAIDAELSAAQLAGARKDFSRADKVLDGLGTALTPDDAKRVRAVRLALSRAKSDLDAAQAILREELASNPRDVNTIRRLAELDIERRDWDSVGKSEQLLDAAGAVGVPFASYYRTLRLLNTPGANGALDVQAALAEQSKLAALRPRWAATHVLGGMIEQRLGRTEQAITSYQKAIQLGETRVYVFEQLVALLENQRRFAEAEKILARFESEMPFSQSLTELGSAQQLRDDRQEEALKLARDGIAQRPNDPDAHMWLGKLLLACNRAADAEPEFLRAVEIAPEDVRSWNGLFSYYAQTGSKDKAHETLAKLAASAKLSDADRKFVLGQGFELMSEWEEAAKHYQQASAELPENVAILLRLAAVTLRTDPPKAESLLQRALKLDPTSALGRRMLAALWASRGDENSRRQAEKLLDGGDSDALLSIDDRRLNARQLARQGGFEKAVRSIELFESIIKSGGGIPADHLVLAQLFELQAKGSADKTDAAAKLDAAQRHLVTIAARTNPDLTHLAALIDFLLRHKQESEAAVWLDSYEKTLGKVPRVDGDAITQLILLRIRHGSADDRLDKWFDKLEQGDSNAVRPLALRARALAANGKADQIRPLVEPKADQILSLAKDDAARAKIHRSLGDLYFTVSDYASAETWYRQLAADQPERLDLLVTCVARQGRLSEAVELCAAAMKSDNTPRPAIRLTQVLAENSATPAELASADPLISAALQRHPKDVGLLYSAAILCVLQGGTDEAIQSFRKILELNPRHLPSLNNLAVLLGERPTDRSEALNFIDRAIEVAGFDPALFDTKGAILVYRGQFEEALKWLVPAAESAAADSRHNFHLALAYRGAGDLIKAREELDKALEKQLKSQILTATDRRLLQDLLTIIPPQ